MVRIPDELVTLAAERRLIPFVGAGFSASLGLPSWESMLRDVCDGLDSSVEFDELLEATNNDLLQVAEYLYLRHDRQIGPIRHQIERSFSARPVSPLESGAHVELVNLNPAQIYTTNYDDIIEQTYRKLGLPVASVILPKDVALADTERTQVVKYHGDLAHERTLVLTESAYYKRLDFESPMDLKFRSDLLGKSVLFMGYSFRDINIRIIWFKLMEMMRDIPEADRRPSYIVRIEPNPALEALYAAVGLKTIVLNDDGATISDAARAELVGQFLYELSLRAAGRAEGANGLHRPSFVSSAALKSSDDLAERYRGYGFHNRRLGGPLRDLGDPVVARVLTGSVPDPLVSAWEKSVTGLLPTLNLDEMTVSLITRLPASKELTQYVVESLQTNGSPELRPAKLQLLSTAGIWEKIWANNIDPEHASRLLDDLANEIQYQAVQGADEDIAYLAELAKRIELGILVDANTDNADNIKSLKKFAADLLALAATIYPTIQELQPTNTDAPNIGAVLAEIHSREKSFKPVEIDAEKIIRARYRTRFSRLDPTLLGRVAAAEETNDV